MVCIGDNPARSWVTNEDSLSVGCGDFIIVKIVWGIFKVLHYCGRVLGDDFGCVVIGWVSEVFFILVI
jgi:hypothetical protein